MFISHHLSEISNDILSLFYIFILMPLNFKSQNNCFIFSIFQLSRVLKIRGMGKYKLNVYVTIFSMQCCSFESSIVLERIFDNICYMT